MEMTSLFQIWYDEKQLPKILPFAVPVHNPGLTIYFENEVIKNLVSSFEGEKLGVCSWKLADKMRIRVGVRGALTPQVMESDYQVLSLTRNSQRHTMLAFAYAWHPGFKETFEKLWTKLGYKVPREVKNPIYQNSFLAKKEIYQDYVNNFLAPAIALTESDEEINKLMRQPSGYGRISRDADLRSVKSKLGLNDYPLSPFILERCPSCYFEMKGYKVTYL